MTGDREIGPAGIPIGRSLILPRGPLVSAIRNAVSAVEVVHGDGVLPPIPLLPNPAVGQIRGRFRFDAAGPISISINPNFGHVELTVVHEIGHVLDLEGLGRPGTFASVTDAALQPWQEAIQATRRFDELTESVAAAIAAAPDRRSHYSEPLLIEECWARSYAQYVALRSRDRSLLESIDAFRGGSRAERVVGHLLHWADDDFAPVEEAIEALFQELGWRSAR